MWGGYPGQSGGTATVNILTGKTAPSGRLPITQYPAAYVDAIPMTDMALRPSSSSPGRTYKWYTGTPVFEFGFGLSYTNFSYSGLSVSKVHEADGTFKALEAAWAAGEPTPVGAGSSTALWLHRPAFEVSFAVKNTGGVTGGEVRLPLCPVLFPLVSPLLCVFYGGTRG